MSVTHDQYRRARSIVEPASLILLNAIREEKRGRNSLDPLILLLGMQLSIDKYNVATITKIHSVLTQDLMLQDQLILGSRKLLPNGQTRVITISDLYNLTRRITRMLEFSKIRAALLSKEERHLRRDKLDKFVSVLLDATLPPRPTGSHDYALDGTGIWAAERSLKAIPKGAPPEPEHEEDLPVISESLTQPPTQVDMKEKSAPSAQSKSRRGGHGESDAATGAKTDKDGKGHYFFGYDVEAIVRVPALAIGNERIRTEPNLLERLVVIPGGIDIVNPCLRMFDRMLAEGTQIKALLVDRHYSYKKFDRWLQELINRDIEQVCDLHARDQGFRDWDGMKMAAGWAHCPATPERLGTIPSLSPTASREEGEIFAANILERGAFAAKRINPLDKDGKTRFGCPALNGTVGCPIRPETVATAIQLHLPIVTNPPGEIGRPSICTQQSVQMQVKTKPQKMAMKIYQRSYWGSNSWRLNYARRTYVESWFGVLKNTPSTGFHRGSHQFRGLPLVTIVLAVAAATTNLQLLRAWHAETGLGDVTHPLLQPDQKFYGFTELTEVEAAHIDDQHRKAS